MPTQVKPFVYKESILQLNQTQQVAFALLCAKEIYQEKKWNTWADKWLTGEDRRENSAWNASNAFAAFGSHCTRVSDSAPCLTINSNCLIMISGNCSRSSSRAYLAPEIDVFTTEF